VFDAPDLKRLHDLVASIPDLRVASGQESLTVSIPLLNALLEFRTRS
jgi:hypothetical protein